MLWYSVLLTMLFHSVVLAAPARYQTDQTYVHSATARNKYYCMLCMQEWGNKMNSPITVRVYSCGHAVCQKCWAEQVYIDIRDCPLECSSVMEQLYRQIDKYVAEQEQSMYHAI
jgi:phage major head subunit gpT-like protein